MCNGVPCRSFLRSTRRKIWTNLGGFRAIGWKNSKAADPRSIRYELTSNGGSVSFGAHKMLMTLRSSTIIGKAIMATRRKRDIPPVHPGEILKADFLEPLDLKYQRAERSDQSPANASERHRPRSARYHG